MRVSDLKPNPANPRAITDERLAMLGRSLKEHGDLSGIVVNVRTGNLVGGHQRLKHLDPKWKVIKRAAKDNTGTVALGMIETPFGALQYREVDWPKKKETQAMLAANQHGGEWDTGQLRGLIEGMDGDARLLAGFDLDGLKEAGIELNGEDMRDAQPQIDHAKALQKKWKTKRGQVWRVGEHRLLCGDATKREDMERVMQSDKADAILTDPVYGQSQEGVPNDSPEQMARIVPVVCSMLPATDAVAVLFQSPRTFTVALDAMRLSGWNFERMLWMDKVAQCAYPWRGWILKSEAILLFTIGNPTWNEVRPFSHDVYRLPEVSGELSESLGWHGAVKPLKVVTDICHRISKESQHVYDPFLGSGTTMVACHNLGRKCVGVEIAPEYVAVALQRMKDAFGLVGELA